MVTPMKVHVVYAGAKQVVLHCPVHDGQTVGEAIENSGILNMCRDIDLGCNKIGIYGRFVRLDSPLKDGDRIEIYRKITRILDDDDDD